MREFYILSAKADTGVFFMFLDAKLHLRHVHPSPTIQLAHKKGLEKVNARYTSRVAVKSFTFGAASKSVSIDNALLETLSKRLLLTILRNTNFTGSPCYPLIFQAFWSQSFCDVRELATVTLRRPNSEHYQCKDLYDGLPNALQWSRYKPRKQRHPDHVRPLRERMLHAQF